eukprot:5566593-Pyramimonas_sp.AAC.3
MPLRASLLCPPATWKARLRQRPLADMALHRRARHAHFPVAHELPVVLYPLFAHDAHFAVPTATDRLLANLARCSAETDHRLLRAADCARKSTQVSATSPTTIRRTFTWYPECIHPRHVIPALVAHVDLEARSKHARVALVPGILKQNVQLHQTTRAALPSLELRRRTLRSLDA